MRRIRFFNRRVNKLLNESNNAQPSFLLNQNKTKQFELSKSIGEGRQYEEIIMNSLISRKVRSYVKKLKGNYILSVQLQISSKNLFQIEMEMENEGRDQDGQRDWEQGQRLRPDLKIQRREDLAETDILGEIVELLHRIFDLQSKIQLCQNSKKSNRPWSRFIGGIIIDSINKKNDLNQQIK